MIKFCPNMQEWLKVTLLLCSFGLLREIRPSEPYVTEFLTDNRWRNITDESVYRDVYPVGTYSYLSLLFVVFLVTDLARYKPVIVTSGVSGIVVYTILLWTESLAWLQVSQFFYGLYIATEVAYYTYMFTKVERDKYAAVSSWTRSAALTGRLISGVTAQLLTSFQLMNYRELNYITLSAQIMSTLWAIMLPPVRSSLYFHQKRNSLAGNKQSGDLEKTGLATVLKRLLHEARNSYSNSKLAKWSAFYAMTACGFIQVQTYVQSLWKDIDPNVETAYNGLVEACLTGGGALGAALAGKWEMSGRHIATAFSLVQGLLLGTSIIYPRLVVAYVVYVIVGIMHHYLITLASTKIASQLEDESFFGLVFGINTLVATALQALLTFVVITALQIEIRRQFLVYSCWYIAIFVAWVVAYLVGLLKRQKGATGIAQTERQTFYVTSL